MCSRSGGKIHAWFFILASPLDSVSLSLFPLFISLSQTHTHTQTNIFVITIIPKTDFK